ncbi:MAG: hypothetical protein MJK10_19025 [Pseudomonadales bacterium]|nr:hypothetical protein [Pseudomonadales bacterium]NRA18380.1 hypothetical protein [Oceanospirillaceae bacterium]
MGINQDSFYAWARANHPSVSKEFLEQELAKIAQPLRKKVICTHLMTDALALAIGKNISSYMAKTIDQVTQHIDNDGATVYAAWCGKVQSVYLLGVTLAEPDTALTELTATKEVKYFGYQYISEAVGLDISFSECLQQLGWLEVEDEYKMLTVTILGKSEQQ